MPYGIGYGRRVPRYTARGRRNFIYGGRQSVPYAVYKNRKDLMRLKPEKKYKDFAYGASGTSFSIPNNLTEWTTSTQVKPNLPATYNGSFSALQPGSGHDQRIGNKVRALSLVVNGTVTMPVQAADSTADVAPTIKIVLANKVDADGDVGNPTQLFTNPSGVNETVTVPLRNKDYMKDWEILAETTFTMPMPPMANHSGAASGLVQGGVDVPWTLSKYWKNGKIIKYLEDATAGTEADVVRNNMCIFVNQGNSGHTCKMYYNARLTYTDV